MLGLIRLLFVTVIWLLLPMLVSAEPSVLPAAPLRMAFGSRCAKSPIPCNRIDYFTAHFHIADVVLLPSTDSRGFGATVGYGASLSLFHRVEIGLGGTLGIWSQANQGTVFQNGPALLDVKGVLFPLLRNPVPDSEFTFGLQLQQQLRIPKFEGANDLGSLAPLTALRAVADKPFWRMGITASLGFLLTQGRTDSELSTSLRIHLPWMSRATVQGFGVLQGLFGSRNTAPLRGGFGLSVHFAWDNGTSLSGGYVQGRGDGIAPSAIYIGGPDYHIGRETADQSYSRPPIPNREMVPSPWPWLWEKLKQEWTEAELASEAHRRGEDWLTDECFLYEDGKYDKPLRHLGKRDASGKFCKVGEQLVPMDAPLSAVGSDLMPVSPPSGPQPNIPTAPAKPNSIPVTTPSTSEPSAAAPLKSKKHRDRREQRQTASESRNPQTDQVATAPMQPPEANPSSPSSPVRRERPSLGDSATEFARGFAKGVGQESLQIYEDTKELPGRLAKTGREVVEDLQAGRELRALAPLLAMERAVRNASRDDVERVAHGVIVASKEWLDKPAYEKGASLGRATTSLAADAAMGVLTEGIGTLVTLRKLERTAEAADHVRDAEKVVEKTAKVGNHLDDAAAAMEKHSGFRRVYAERSPAEIKKGISSLERQIAEHESKIANPERHIPGWSSLDPRQQRALIEKKWPSDIARQAEQRDILKSLLERGQTPK